MTDHVSVCRWGVGWGGGHKRHSSPDIWTHGSAMWLSDTAEEYKRGSRCQQQRGGRGGGGVHKTGGPIGGLPNECARP